MQNTGDKYQKRKRKKGKEKDYMLKTICLYIKKKIVESHN